MNSPEVEETHMIFADENNWIKLKGTKVIDIVVGDYRQGCRCSTSFDGGRYDKERQEILCKAKDSCCNSVLRMICTKEEREIKKEPCGLEINEILADEADRTKKKNADLIDRIEELKEEREKLREELENLRKEKDKWEDNYYRVCMDLIDERNRK